MQQYLHLWGLCGALLLMLSVKTVTWTLVLMMKVSDIMPDGVVLSFLFTLRQSDAVVTECPLQDCSLLAVY